MARTARRSQPTVGVTFGDAFHLPHAESRLLCSARPNLLIEGPESTTDAVLVALTPHLRQPLWTWCAGVQNGTLIVRRVNQLDGGQQKELLEWLEVATGRVQVIATSSEPLFPLVKRGTFLDVLYYQLNVVRVEVTATSLSHAS